MKLSELEKIMDSGLPEDEKKALSAVIKLHKGAEYIDEESKRLVKDILKAQRQRRRILNEIAAKIKRKCEYESMGWRWTFLKLSNLIRPDAKKLAAKIKAQESVSESDQELAAKIMQEAAEVVTQRFKRKEAEGEINETTQTPV